MRFFCSSRILLTRTVTPRPLALSSTLPAARRDLHVSRPCRAAEDPNGFMSRFEGTKLFTQLADKPEALQAIATFAKLLQDKGVDVGSGKQPSAMTMFKLAADKDFREAAKNLVQELQAAGIDLQSKELMDEVMRVRDGKP